MAQPSQGARRHGDVLQHRQVREQIEGLEHHAHVGAHLVEPGVVDQAPVLTTR
jgi:hypothetical protein